MGKDQVNVHSRFVQANILTLGNNQPNARQVFWLIPTVYGTEDPGSAILRNYQHYRVMNTRYTWQPSCGSTTRGFVYMAYFDNAELMQKLKYNIYSEATVLSLCKACSDGVSGPVWMPLTYSPRQVRQSRRTQYTSNQNLPESTWTNGAEEYAVRSQFDLSVQGVLVICAEGCDASDPGKVLGFVETEYDARGFDMVSNAIAGI